ncbi:hemoglobin/transferrin/lactoferrin receptor protein [Thalassospira xiamenensis M-5 = DSM 17429]|uniref:TonB-dependent receptor n=1 Tax=Thalassospira xiamenensis M-5 = DSM 17429 TaxID=1123366 RepID=A0AB72UDX7_9PROT|nr:TonB-dependent receptor [Thalassospira xiamenensis]AJD52425.1 TonB-dependent receptor [Thalassospira xiamenensis M-5 = DSM 17429]SIT30859.1 hemoglobin/transferrin/lactoferrin receptor protein [Thalassospira xiamenensis M-5 = DSM 17429]
MPQPSRPVLLEKYRQPFHGLCRATLLAGVALTVLPVAAVAQETKAKDETVLAPIEVTASQDSGPTAAGSVTVTQDELDRINPQTIKDVFANEPSVQVGGPTAIAQKVYVQGIENTKLNVQVDGTRQVDSTYHHIGTAIIDPGMLKSVKVESGIAPADAGPNALGGSMAYETKDARDILDPNDPFGGFAKIQYNSNTKGLTEWLTLAGQHDGFEALAYIQNSNQGNYKDGDDNEVAGTADGSENGLGKIAFTGTEGSRIEAFASHFEDEGVRPARPNFGTLTSGASPQWISYKDTSLGISYVDEQPTDLLAPELSLNYSKTHLDVPKLNGNTHLEAEIETLNGKAANTFDVGMGGITTGVDFYHDQATGSGDTARPAGRAGRFTEETTNIGVFSQARLSLTDRWRVSFGGRGDQQWFEGIDGTDFSEFGLSGNANTEYDLTDDLMIYGGLGTSFGGLPLGESAIYNYTGIWTYDGFKPSRSHNYKAGARYQLAQWDFDGNLFYNKINGSHSLEYTTRNTTSDLATRGVNLSVTWTYGPGFVRAAYTHTDVERNGKVPLSNDASYQGVIVGDIANFEVAHRFDDLGIQVGSTSELALSDDDPEKNGNAKLDTYFVANLYGEWTPETLSNAVTLRVDALNIFDRDYVARTTPGYDSSAIEPYHEPGRTFLVSAKVAF